MKLLPKNGVYNSPMAVQGKFENVFIEDREITIKRNENFLSVKFVMFYLKDEKEIILGSKTMEFCGLENDYANSTNIASIFKYPNPDYDPNFDIAESKSDEDYKKTIEWIENVKLMEYLALNNNKLPYGAIITEYGYPTFEVVLQYFEGGTLDDPEVQINNEFAQGFLLNKLSINGEIVGDQFIFLS
ncbi:hypothetical protein [Zunongwangia endophytica]|uniref:Uncharacterized protein n=1 Tax=Zunongwangia endophytica TaxID=1808945 RepID=A0ABV8H8E3_9FLAO|nr:hypothetical protein [Zunongwangia endophytica]MDN3595324.1 hypothetical protein [Zunongwangia endophytica]